MERCRGEGREGGEGEEEARGANAEGNKRVVEQDELLLVGRWVLASLLIREIVCPGVSLDLCLAVFRV